LPNADRRELAPQHVELVSEDKDLDFQRNPRRNSSIKAHQINLHRSLIGSEYQPIRGRGQPFWFAVGTAGVCIEISITSTSRDQGVSLRGLVGANTSARTSIPGVNPRRRGGIIAGGQRPCPGGNR